MERLNEPLLSNLKHVARPKYERGKIAAGLVHIGVGGFHRAHQAFYTEQVLNAGDRRWGTIGANLRSSTTRDALAPQAYLYSVSTRDTDSESLAVHGGLLDMVVKRDALIQAIANPEVQVVTLTITEKGYHEGSVVAALLADALKARMNIDAPLTLVSCDNLTGNGDVLRDRIQSVCEPGVLSWIQDRVGFPNTMVDRITPQTTKKDIDHVATLGGFRDAAPVVCEPFCQWVIEDDFRGERPEWEIGGASLVRDVEPFEQAKLRLLNASHSMFAYLGLLKSYEFIHESIADRAIRRFVQDTLTTEILPNVHVPSEMDAASYLRSIMQRFANEAVPYRTTQVASDGSAKLPQRIYPTAQLIWSRGESAPRLELAMAAWLATLNVGYPDPGIEDVRESILRSESPVRLLNERNSEWSEFPSSVIERLDQTHRSLVEQGLNNVLDRIQT